MDETKRPGAAADGPGGDDTPWILRPGTVRTLRLAFGVFLVALVALDLGVKHYQHFGVDGTFGFYPWYAFLSCVGAVVAAKVLSIFLRRSDDYYEPQGEPGEPGALAGSTEGAEQGGGA